MNSRNQKFSPSPIALALALVCGVSVVFVLFYVFAFQQTSERQSVAGVVRVTPIQEYATATLFPGAPPFPTAPLGETTPLPTPDVDSFGPMPDFDKTTEEPEETQAPDAKVTEPIQVVASPERPRLDFVSFEDPFLGVAFEYPANWFVIPAGPQREYITLQNSDPDYPATGEGGLTSDHFNVEIKLIAEEAAKNVTLEQFVDIVEKRIPEGYLLSREEINFVDGNRAIKVIYKDPPAPNNLFGEIFVMKGDRIYDLVIIPPNTKYEQVLEHFLASIRLP